MMKKDLVLNGFRVPSDGTKLDPDKFYETILTSCEGVTMR